MATNNSVTDILAQARINAPATVREAQNSAKNRLAQISGVDTTAAPQSSFPNYDEYEAITAQAQSEAVMQGMPLARRQDEKQKDLLSAVAGGGVGVANTVATGGALIGSGWRNIGEAFAGKQATPADEWINNTTNALGINQAQDYWNDQESSITKGKRAQLSSIMENPNIGEIERAKQTGQYYLDNPDMLGLDTAKVVPQSLMEMYIGGKFIKGSRHLNKLGAGTKAGINAGGSISLNTVNQIARNEDVELTPRNLAVAGGIGFAGGAVTKLMAGGKGFDVDGLFTGGSNNIAAASAPRAIASGFAKEFLEEATQEGPIEGGGMNYIEGNPLMQGVGGKAAQGGALGATSSFGLGLGPNILNNVASDAQLAQQRRVEQDQAVNGKPDENADVESPKYNPSRSYKQAIRDQGSNDPEVRKAALDSMKDISYKADKKMFELDEAIRAEVDPTVKADLIAQKDAFENEKLTPLKAEIKNYMNYVQKNQKELLTKIGLEIGQVQARRTALTEAASAEIEVPETSTASMNNGTPTAATAPATAPTVSPNKGKYSDLIDGKAKQYGVAPTLINAMVQAESAFDPNAKSPVGASGLMQLMPDTAEELGVHDSTNPEQNIDGGVRYIKQLQDKYKGNITHALMAYNWGMGNVDQYIADRAAGKKPRMPEETRNYVNKIKANVRSMQTNKTSSSSPSTARDPKNYLKYSNSGASRNEKLDSKLEKALGFLQDMGVTYDINSGGQSATSRGKVGSTAHNDGHAGDGVLIYKGRELHWNNKEDLPILEKIVEEAAANGINAIGAGYMGKRGKIHFGIQKNGGAWGGGGTTDSPGFKWVTDAQERGKNRKPTTPMDTTAEVQEEEDVWEDVVIEDIEELNVEESPELTANTKEMEDVKERGKAVIRNSFSTLTNDEIDNHPLMSTEQKEALRVLSGIKTEMANLRDTNKVTKDIMEGDQKSKSGDPQTRHLGVKQYNEILTQAVAVNDVETVNKYMGFLNRFAENHESKSELIQRLIPKSSRANPIKIAPNEDGLWVDATKFTDAEYKAARGTEVRGSNKMTTAIAKESEVLSNLRDAWETSTTTMMEGVTPSVAKTPTKVKTPNVPVNQTPTPTAPVSSTKYSPVDNSQATPEGGFYLGRVKDAEGITSSMSIINPNKDGSADNIGKPGWLGDQNKNKPVSTYITDFKEYASKYEKFVPQLIEDLSKDLYGYVKPANNSETNFLADMSEMIEGKSKEEVSELVKRIQSYTKKGGIKLETAITEKGGLTNKMLGFDKVNEFGLNTTTDETLSENKAQIDNMLADNPNTDFPSTGLGANIQASAPKTFQYLNEKLKSELGVNNAELIKNATTEPIESKKRSSIKAGKKAGKASAPIKPTKTPNEKSNKSATGDKEYTNQYTHTEKSTDEVWEILINRNSETNEIEDVSLVQGTEPVESFTTPSKTMSDEAVIKWLQQGPEKVTGIYTQTNYNLESVVEPEMKTEYVGKTLLPTDVVSKVNKLVDVMSNFINDLDMKNITTKDKALYTSIINTLNNFNPNLKLKISKQGENSYDVKTNTITVNPSNGEHILKGIARLSIESSTSNVVNALEGTGTDNLSYKGSELVKLNKDITYIKQIINRNGLLGTDEKLDINLRKRLLNALSSNSNLLSAATTDTEIMEYLQSISYNLENNKAKSSVFKKIVDSLRSFFKIGNNNEIATMYDKLLEITARAAQVQAMNKEVSFNNTEEGKASIFQNMLEANSDEEMAKSYYSRNNLLAKFKQVTSKGKPLSGVANLASKLKLDLMQGINTLANLSPSRAQREQMEDFLKFRDELAIHLMDTFVQKKITYNDDGSVKNDFSSQDLKSHLMDAEGNIDENTLTAAALAAYDWSSEYGNKTINLDKDIRKLLNLDPESKDSIPSHIRDQYIDGVMIKNTQSSSLGNKTLQLLNIQSNLKGSIEVESELANSIGEWIVNSMQSADLIHMRTMSSDTHIQNITDVGGELVSNSGNDSKDINDSNGLITFISTVDKDSKNRNPRLQEIVDASRGTLNYMQSIFGSEIGLVSPLMKKPEETKKSIRGTSKNISDMQAADMAVMQDEPMRVNDDSYDALMLVMEKFRGDALVMMEAEVTDEQLAAEHVSDRHSVQSAAEGQFREIENMMDFVGTLGKDSTGNREEFFDSVYGAKNNRMHYGSNMVNFQLSKIHRSVVEYGNFKSEIDISQWNESTPNWFNEDGTTSDLGLMLRGIMEQAEGTENLIREALKGTAFSQGFTVDKLPSEVALDPFFDYLNSDPQVLKAIDAMDILMNNPNKFNQLDMDSITELVSFWEGGAGSFRVLSELTKLMKASKKGDTKITTSIGVGSDGVNNGIAISTIQMGVAKARFLAQVGIITTAEEYSQVKGYFDTRKIKDLGDYYEGLKTILLPYLESQTGVAKSMIDLNTSIKERKFMKAILIPFGYSAGNKRLEQIAFSQVLEDIKGSFKKLAAMDETSQKAIDLKLQLESDLSNVIGSKVNLPQGKAVLEYWFDNKQIKAMKEVHSSGISEAILESIEEYAGTFILERNRNVKMQGANSEAYLVIKREAEYKAKEAYVESLKESDLYKDMPDKQVRAIVEAEGMPAAYYMENAESVLAKIRPSVRTPFNNLTEDSDSDFNMMRDKKTLKGNPNSSTAGKRVSDGNLESSTVASSIMRMIEESVGITVSSAQVQGVDAFIAAWASARGGKVNRNIHDQGDSGVSNYMTMGQAQNQATFEALKIYHVQAESYSSLKRTLKSMTELLENEEISRATYEEGIKKMVEGLIGNKGLETAISEARDGGIVSDSSTMSQVFTAVYLPIFSDFNQSVKDAEYNKLDTLKTMRVVQQYAGENAEYLVTDADRASVDLEYAKVDSKIQNMKDTIYEVGTSLSKVYEDTDSSINTEEDTQPKVHEIESLLAQFVSKSNKTGDPISDVESSLFRYVIDAMKSVNPDLKVTISKEEGIKSNGYYKPTTNEIVLLESMMMRSTPREAAAVLVHEVVHAITTNKMLYSMDPEVRAAFNELQLMHTELAAKAPKRMTEKGGTLENVFEMIAYGMTEAKHMKWIVANLNGKDYAMSNTVSERATNLERFMGAVKTFLFGDKQRKSKKYLKGVANFSRMQQLMDITIKGLTEQELKASKAGLKANQYSNAQQSPLENLKSLSEGNVSSEHVEHLNGILDSTISDRINRSPEDETMVQGIIDNISQRAIAAGFRLSDKELYTMEIVKAITNSYLEKNSGSKSAQELREVFKNVTKQLTRESFLSDSSTATASDIAIAQRKLNYVMAQDAKNYKEQVERFTALAATSEEFRTLVDSLSSERKSDRQGTWFDKLMAALENMFRFTTGKVLGTNGPNSQQVDQLMNHLSKINERALSNNMSKIDTMYTESLKVITTPLNWTTNKLIDGIFQAVDMSTSVLPANSGLAAATRAMTKARKTGINEIGEQLIRNNAAMGPNSNTSGRQSGWGEFLNELVRTKGMKATVEELIRMTNKVGQTRDTVKKNTVRALMKVFSNNGEDLTVAENNSLTQVILRTDIGSLLGKGYQVARVMKLIRNPQERALEVSKLETQILGFSNGNDMILQTKSLALYMAKEESSEHLVKNAENIAIGKDSWYETDMSNMNTDIRDAVDSLASLYAIDYADQTHRTTLIDLMSREEEGVKAILQTHKDIAIEAKKGFSENPYSYIKGYSPQLTNPLKSLVFSETKKEIDELKLKGWVEVSDSRLKQDRSDNTDARSLMFHDDMLYQDYVSGALDMKDTHAKGTTVYNLSSLNDLNRVQRVKMQARRSRVNSTDYMSFDPRKETKSNLIAAYNSEGVVMSYGYEMGGNLRDTYLERNNNGFEMLGTMQSDAKFKPTIAESQREVARALHTDFGKSYGTDPRQYVTLDPNSKDPNVQTMWKMMPYAFKEEATKLFGKDNPIVVRSNVYNAVFGFKAYSISDMFDAVKTDNSNTAEKLAVTVAKAVMGEKAQTKVLQAERLYQKGIDKMKSFIVIRNHAVLMGNIIANSLLLSLHGVPPAQQMKDMISVWRNGGNYRKLASRITEIDTELSINQSRPKEVSRLNREKNIALKEMEQNPMHTFMEAGLMSTIVEDIGVNTEDTGFKSDLDKKIEELEGYVPEQVRTAFEWVVMSPGTPLHDFMKHSTQFSDLAAKYSLANHVMKDGTSMKDAITLAQDNFINYDVPTGKGIDYMNRMGLFMFTKFFIRFQQVLMNRLDQKAGSTIAQHVGMEYFTGLSGVLDPLAITRLGNSPLEAGIFNYGNAFGNISTIDFITGT